MEFSVSAIWNLFIPEAQQDREDNIPMRLTQENFARQALTLSLGMYYIQVTCAVYMWRTYKNVAVVFHFNVSDTFMQEYISCVNIFTL